MRDTNLRFGAKGGMEVPSGTPRCAVARAAEQILRNGNPVLMERGIFLPPA
jgi:hypothetical protein